MTLTTDELDLMRIVAARAAQDETCRALVLAGNVDGLRAEMPRIMDESITRQSHLLAQYRGEEWTHETREDYQRITVLEDVYTSVRAS